MAIRSRRGACMIDAASRRTGSNAMHARANSTALILALAAAAPAAMATPIDFETLPDGSPTADLQTISDQYLAAFGVRFDLVDPTTLEPIGSPQIAKVGAPQTAFDGCGPDTPFEPFSAGQTLLTDDNAVSGEVGTVLITYAAPVSQLAGVIFDVDRRNGAANFEQWTIEALGASMEVVQSIVLTAPDGDDVCTNNHGPGDATALGYSFDRPSPDIHFVVFRYTGTVSTVGLAFDNFSPDSIPDPPTVTIDADPPADLCFGQIVTISAAPSGGLVGYSYQWQQAPEGEPFADIAGERGPTLSAPALPGVAYRVILRDALQRTATSDPIILPDPQAVNWTLSIETAPDSGAFDLVSTTLEPYILPSGIDAYYGWTNSEQYYHGGVPALSTDRSHLFLTVGANGTAIVIVHDAVGPNGSGRAEMVLDFTGVQPGILTEDDPADAINTSDPQSIRTRHNWTSPNTDGFALGPLDGTWTAEVRFEDTFSGAPTIGGLTAWAFVSADGTEFALPLEEQRRVRIEAACSCKADLTGDGIVNSDDLGILLGAFGSTDAGDINADGATDSDDLGILLGLFGGECLRGIKIP
ncbi:MAG: hypothetical protein ACTS3F_10850 [Phycisphaerales bacterium]